jgi:hypothetical protein
MVRRGRKGAKTPGNAGFLTRPRSVIECGRFFSLVARDREKACPGPDPVWKPVFGIDHAAMKHPDHAPVQLDRIVVWRDLS